MTELSAIHRAAPQPLGKSAARPHPTGAKGRIEAACRMVQNSLDPEVAGNADARVGA